MIYWFLWILPRYFPTPASLQYCQYHPKGGLGQQRWWISLWKRGHVGMLRKESLRFRCTGGWAPGLKKSRIWREGFLQWRQVSPSQWQSPPPQPQPQPVLPPRASRKKFQHYSTLQNPSLPIVCETQAFFPTQIFSGTFLYFLPTILPKNKRHQAAPTNTVKPSWNDQTPQGKSGGRKLFPGFILLPRVAETDQTSNKQGLGIYF